MELRSVETRKYKCLDNMTHEDRMKGSANRFLSRQKLYRKIAFIILGLVVLLWLVFWLIVGWSPGRASQFIGCWGFIAFFIWLCASPLYCRKCQRQIPYWYGNLQPGIKSYCPGCFNEVCAELDRKKLENN